MTAIFATCKKTASTECKNDKFLKYSIFSIQYSIDSILYLSLNIKYQIRPELQTTSRNKIIRETNHHRALGKRKFSFKYPVCLRTNFYRVIQPVSHNPDNFIAAQYDRTFRPFGSRYFVIDKKFL